MDTIEAEAPPADGTDSGSDAALAGADQGSSSESQGGDQSFETPFSLDDVPEEFRGDVERYVKQTQGAFTRKTQELAAERRRAAEMLDFDGRLADPNTRQEALGELLARYDLALDYGEDDEEGDYERPDELDAFADVPDEELPEWAQELIERDKAREEREQQEAARNVESRLRGHVSTALDGYREAAYEGQDALPENINDALLGLGMIVPPRSDGLPDMEGAIAMLEAIEAAAVQRFVDSKRKTPPVPATRRGTSGTEKPDLSTEVGRLRQANLIAARHTAE